MFPMPEADPRRSFEQALTVPAQGHWRAYWAAVAASRRPMDEEASRVNAQFIRGARGFTISLIASLLSLINMVFAVLVSALIIFLVPLVYGLALLLYPLYRWRVFKRSFGTSNDGQTTVFGPPAGRADLPKNDGVQP